MLASLLTLGMVSVIAQLVISLLVGGLVFGALCLLTEDILKEKWQEYLITGAAFAILDFTQAYIDIFGILGLFELIAFVWVPYKWLDFSLLRSFGVLGCVLVSLMLIGMLC